VNYVILVFFAISDFLLENVLSLALPESSKIEMCFFHSFSNFSQKIINSLVFINIDQDAFGVILPPAGFELKVSVISAVDFLVVS
jgi:hypothetical protein